MWTSPARIDGGDDAFADQRHRSFASSASRAQRVPGASQPGAVDPPAQVDCAAPIQRLVLGVALAQAQSDLGLGQFGAEIEGVRAVLFRRRVRRTARTRRWRRDGRRGCRRGCRPQPPRCGSWRRAPGAASSAISSATAAKRLLVVDLQQRRRHSPWAALRPPRAAYMMRRAASCSSIVRRVCGLTWTISTLRIASSEQMPEQQRRDAASVGVGEFRQIAGAHQHFGVRAAPAQPRR